MFTSVSARSASAYKRASVDASVEMANPHQLVTMLFEALQRTLGAASAAMAAGDVSAKCNHISSAIRILDEGFIAPLDLAKGGELAANLKNLYEYCVRRLALANAKNDPSIVEEVKQLIAPIASGWKQIDGQGPAYLKPV
ncbi:MAG: flagellar export chaperone FliS [Curvibacter sp.]|jgi:flagellar protein FliS|nr:MAG: flagellar export chaperone FliS [Curvibacter sp.]